MSTEVNVVFRGKLPDRKALSRMMAELGFQFTIASCVGSLERQSGFMPMWLRREDTGVEFDVDTDDDRSEIAEMEEISGRSIDPSFDRVAAFRWGGDERQMAAGLCGAAALAKLVNGVFFEDMEGQLLSPDEAVAYARENVQPLMKWLDSGRRGTRPDDIKHYLKPLLKQRNDLVVIGRLLLIRPVRHVLRGVCFEPTNDKCNFRIVPYLKPLCAGNPSGLGYRNSIHDHIWRVWQPHFEPLLMNVLEQDIFDSLGRITSLGDLADELVSDTDHAHSIAVTALVLSGERERAAEYVQRSETKALTSGQVKSWVEAQRVLLARDINDVCAEAHASEAKTVKALRLQGIWEPSPFPVELPEAERRDRTAERSFVPQPWVARPPSLLESLPDQAGDVKFAKDWLVRNGERVLVAPINREQAEERHQNGEDYLLVARLPDGLLLRLQRDGTDRDDPDRFQYPRPASADYSGGLTLTLYGSQFVTRAEFDRNYDVDGMLRFTSVDIRAVANGRPVWNWTADRHSDEQSVEDHRSGEKIQTEGALTAADWDRLTFPRPDFGQFEGLVETVGELLRSEGYGELS